MLSWYARRAEPDSLVMTYRWVVKNKPAAIARLADLIDVELTPELEALVLERTTREFMHAHKDRFDDAMMCAVMEEKLGIPADSDSRYWQQHGQPRRVGRKSPLCPGWRKFGLTPKSFTR